MKRLFFVNLTVDKIDFSSIECTKINNTETVSAAVDQINQLGQILTVANSFVYIILFSFDISFANKVATEDNVSYRREFFSAIRTHSPHVRGETSLSLKSLPSYSKMKYYWVFLKTIAMNLLPIQEGQN